MSGNRKAAEAEALVWINGIDPSGLNGKMYSEEIFPSMSDEQFSKWIDDLETENAYLHIQYPNLTQSKITTENNILFAEKMGVKLYQRIRLQDRSTGQITMGPIPVPILHFPVRRLAQTLDEKISYAEDNFHLDELSNQVTGISKSSAVSTPEIAVWLGSGLDDQTEEFMKYRGGDQKAYRAMERMIAETGESDMDVLEPYTDRAKINYTIGNFLRGAHIENNIDE